jgi:hypothetical protein
MGLRSAADRYRAVKPAGSRQILLSCRTYYDGRDFFPRAALVAKGLQALIIRLSLQCRRMELVLGSKSAYSASGAP